jgi:hypothetical protein
LRNSEPILVGGENLLKPALLLMSQYRLRISPDRPLNYVERDHMDTILSRLHSQDAMHNAEEVDIRTDARRKLRASDQVSLCT